MGQRINPEELREMLKVARKLRASAEGTQDPEYISLFLRGAIALEDRAAQLAYHTCDPGAPDQSAPDDSDPALYRHVDLRC